MHDMPPSVQQWYRQWIGSWPESWHPADMERFYMFVSKLLQVSRKHRPACWLESNLREDCRNLSENNINKYGEIYEHIRDFSQVWKSQQARLMTRSNHEARIQELKNMDSARNK